MAFKRAAVWFGVAVSRGRGYGKRVICVARHGISTHDLSGHPSMALLCLACNVAQFILSVFALLIEVWTFARF